MNLFNLRILIFCLFFPAFAAETGDSIASKENIDAIFSAPTLKKLMRIIQARPELKTCEDTRQRILDKLLEFEVVKKEIQPVIEDLGIDLDLVNGKKGINTQAQESGATALSMVMILGDQNVEFIEKMLKHSADPNIPDAYGNTPLKYMTSYMQLDNDIDERKKCIEIIKLLLSFGANPDFENIYGTTPFNSLANVKVAHGMVDVAELFLLYGVQINKVNSDGNTPLIEAIYNCIHVLEQREKKHIKKKQILPSMAFITFLLDHGANPNKQSSKGIRPLDVVISSHLSKDDVNQLLPVLLSYGATY